MLRFSRSKIIATVAIIVIGLLLAVPSTMNREQRQAFLVQRGRTQLVHVATA